MTKYRIACCVFLTALGFVVMGSVAGCLHFDEKTPVYHIKTEQHLHAEMRSMAGYLTDLSKLSMDDTFTEAEKVGPVLDDLDQIQRIASGIGGPDVITNYSVVNRYMGAFLYDVQLARDFAMRTPPNFFPAYSLVKSCLSCHQSI